MGATAQNNLAVVSTKEKEKEKRENPPTKEIPKEVKAKAKDGSRLRNSSTNKTTTASVAAEVSRATGTGAAGDEPARTMHAIRRIQAVLRIAQRSVVRLGLPSSFPSMERPRAVCMTDCEEKAGAKRAPGKADKPGRHLGADTAAGGSNLFATLLLNQTSYLLWELQWSP